MTDQHWYDPPPGQLNAIEEHAGMPPSYVNVLGKATDSTPFRDPGLFDPANTAPEQGAWMDAYWGGGVFWTWAYGPRTVGTPMAIAYVSADPSNTNIGVTNNNGAGRVELAYNDTTGAMLKINAENGQGLPVMQVSGGTNANTLWFAIRANADVEVAKPGAALILTSPNGTKYRVTVSDTGTLSTAPV